MPVIRVLYNVGRTDLPLAASGWLGFVHQPAPRLDFQVSTVYIGPLREVFKSKPVNRRALAKA